MFIETQTPLMVEKYKRLLQVMGMMSRLFSENVVPYLPYRAHENIFCEAFKADNVSRSDTSIDARKKSIGIGLKTFIAKENGGYEKIAEFNRERSKYGILLEKPENFVKYIAESRNFRLETSQRIYKVDSVCYHCIFRHKGRLVINEEKMELIDIPRIKNLKSKKTGIFFEDGRNEYSFNISKSTLFKRFYEKNPIVVEIEIIENPINLLEEIFNKNMLRNKIDLVEKDSVILPLYSQRGFKHVPERSGLNQWNAHGRPRDEREIYIPIPQWIHNKYSGFFPRRDACFNLKLPNGRTIKAKICQEGGKALMSNPNKELGIWLLDDVFKLGLGQLVTYELLEKTGVDSVEVIKIDADNYSIDFRPINSYEFFMKRV